ncbi:MAG: hypothetical protein AAF664_21435, partial [Planctomycetota bacterium]
MTESTKTGIFWLVAVALALLAMIVAWPSSQEAGTNIKINEPLFAEFKDPGVATSMRIVSFDDEQGELKTFEVRQDPET